MSIGTALLVVLVAVVAWRVYVNVAFWVGYAKLRRGELMKGK